VLRALNAGLTVREITGREETKWARISAWKRWDPAFRIKFNQAHLDNREKRKILRVIDNLLARHGSRITLTPDFELLRNARARAHTRADGRAREDAASVS
jgi:hypothetical protein